MTPRYEPDPPKTRKSRKRQRARRKKSQVELPDQLKAVNLNAAGIDVGASEHWVAVPPDWDGPSVQSFGAMTCDHHRLADWLEECGIETVSMESTGSYWIVLADMLEQRGFEVKLVDAHHLKNVSGRKSDVLDCQWIQQLHMFGLLNGAFRPEDQVRQLRSYQRHRTMLGSYAADHIRHMQKSLLEMNIQLVQVVNDVTGATGLRIIRSILNGERNPQTLAKMRDPQCRHSEEEIAQALEGNWREEHLFTLGQSLSLFEEYYCKKLACDEKIEALLGTFEDRSQGRALPEKKRVKKNRGSLAFDAREDLFRMAGCDLTLVPGLETLSVLKLLSEIGTDMSRWKTKKHFCSWSTLAPGTNITGGKKRRGRRGRPSAHPVAQILRMAASGLDRSPTALGAFLRRKKAQLGAPKAIRATARKLACIVYTMLRDKKEYVELGSQHYEQQYRQRSLRNLRRKAHQFGFELAPCDEVSQAAA